jgi:hypothetical protein
MEWTASGSLEMWWGLMASYTQVNKAGCGGGCNSHSLVRPIQLQAQHTVCLMRFCDVSSRLSGSRLPLLACFSTCSVTHRPAAQTVLSCLPVLLDDGEYQHVNLQQQPYKLVDRPPGTAVARRKSTTPTPPPVPALGGKVGKSAEPSSGGHTATARSSEPPSAQAQQVSEAGSEGAKSGRAGSVDADGPKSDGPVRRSTRAAAMAVTAATKQQQLEAQAPQRERSPVVAAVAAAGPPPPRQAPLNMSNVGRKDREAARALLGFTAMAQGVRQCLRLVFAKCTTQIVAGLHFWLRSACRPRRHEHIHE